jgi:methyl-accepting chemotaxis protein
MKKMSIKTAILIPALAVLVVGIAIMAAIISFLSFNTTSELTATIVDARVNESVNEFWGITQDSYSALAAIVPIVQNLAETSASPRENITLVLTEMLSGSGDSVSAVWTCWEPDALDGRDTEYANTATHDASGRFIPYFFKTGSGTYEASALAGYDDPTEGIFYQGARNSGKPYVTDPYIYAFGGQEIMTSSIAIPILRDGRVLGVVGVDINLDYINEIMNEGKILDDGYIYTLSPGGLFASHPTDSMLLGSYQSTWMGEHKEKVEAVLKNGGSFSLVAYSDVTDTDMNFLGTAVMIGDTGRYWSICGVVAAKEVNASSLFLLLVTVAIGLVLIAVVGLTIFKIVGGRLRDLPTLTATAESLAIGDISACNLKIDMEGTTKNEVTLLGRAFTKMAGGVKEQADILAQMAEGDYSLEPMRVRSERDVMNNAINYMLDNTNSALSEIQQAAYQVAVGSSQVATGAQTLASGSTEQAATLEQFGATISAITEHAENSAKLAQQAKADMDITEDHVNESMQKMNDMKGAMQIIDTGSQQIEKIIKVINDIAFQTNILALNAAVEAARAGQHGKGFAVVSDEVRNLAAKSAAAAKETEELIQTSVDNVRRGTVIAGEAAAGMEKVGDIARKDAEAMAKLSAMSQQQTASIVEINLGMNQIAEVVQENSATAEESAAAAEEMSAQGNMLNEIIKRFKIRVQSKKSGYGSQQPGLPQEADRGYTAAGGDRDAGASAKY